MLNEDYKDMLLALSEEKAKFLLVGAFAMAAHGYPRATMDIDIWVMPSPQNADAVLQNLAHDATVYQFKGWNLCLTDCLTHKPERDEFRQLIFYSNGTLTADWTHPGAIIMGSGKKAREWLRKQRSKKISVKS